MASITRILTELGATILVDETIGDYQGSYVVVLREDTRFGSYSRFGLLIEGYGSCEGCDAWMDARGSLYDTVRLASDSIGSIRWFPTLGELQEWCAQVDPANEWWSNEDQWTEVNDKIQALDGEQE